MFVCLTSTLLTLSLTLYRRLVDLQEVVVRFFSRQAAVDLSTVLFGHRIMEGERRGSVATETLRSTQRG